MKIAIAGATGTAGRALLVAAQNAGYVTVPISRTSGVDLRTRQGLTAILNGVDAVIDLTSTRKVTTKAAISFFGAVTENLLIAEREASVPHHVVLSIIGVAQAESGYYAGKAIQERKVMRSDRGWSILRTTQFHEFAAQTANRGIIGGIQVVPTMKSQPVAVAEVATELVRIVDNGPSGLVPDFAGPKEEDVAAMVRRYLRATGLNRPVLSLPVPGSMGAIMRKGGLLPKSGARLGHQTFDEWLRNP
jgi:uncharacterized protein YbjT (DUF2867 family)